MARSRDVRSQDLLALQEWIASCCESYARQAHDEIRARVSTETRLRSVRNAVNSHGAQAGVDYMRQLLATGAFYYRVGGARPDPRATHVPRTIAIGMATEMLWVLVVIANLPPGWVENLVEVSDLTVAEAVAQARISEISKIDFMRELSKMKYSCGIQRIFHDLNDPSRGGAYVLAIGQSYRKGKSTPMRLLLGGLKFTGTAAIVGIIGNRADALFQELMRSLQGVSPLHGSQPPAAPSSPKAQTGTHSPQEEGYQQGTHSARRDSYQRTSQNSPGVQSRGEVKAKPMVGPADARRHIAVSPADYSHNWPQGTKDSSDSDQLVNPGSGGGFASATGGHVDELSPHFHGFSGGGGLGIHMMEIMTHEVMYWIQLFMGFSGH